MISKTDFFTMITIGLVSCLFNSCQRDSSEIPIEFRSIIDQASTPIEYKEIIPFHNDQRQPIPEIISKREALEDIHMFEYLLKTSYSGFEYWEKHGVDFNSFFANLKKFAQANDSVLTYDFEMEITKILQQIRDGHITITGLESHHAYRHKSVYYCDVLLEETSDGTLQVLSSQNDAIEIGDLFTQQDSSKYLFKTLSPTDKYHYLVGMLSYAPVSSRMLSFNNNPVRIPFHESRLINATFDDPEPFYISRVDSIPIVRVKSFAEKYYPEMQKFMQAGNDLRNEDIVIVNLFYNGGGSSVFPQSFIRNMNGKVGWETDWAILKSPAITEFYAKYNLDSSQEISPDFMELVTSHIELCDKYRNTPVKHWEFASVQKLETPGNYNGTLVLLTNRRVLSAGENMVGASKSIQNGIVIGENTGGSGQFSSTCDYYLPNSRIVAHIPRQLILIPDFEECVGFMPDYWMDTEEPVEEVLDWLDDPENYQFEYSTSYTEMFDRGKTSPSLPSDLNIIYPRSSVPQALRAFSGKWFGVADGVLEHVLVVESIDENLEVNAVYSWGIAYQWNITKPGWQRYKGTFEGEKLILTDKSSKIVITYKIVSDSTLHETYQRPGVNSQTVMRKLAMH